MSEIAHMFKIIMMMTIKCYNP